MHLPLLSPCFYAHVLSSMWVQVDHRVLRWGRSRPCHPPMAIPLEASATVMNYRLPEVVDTAALLCEGVAAMQIVIPRLALRRTKETRVEGGRPVIELPPKHINQVKVTLSAARREKYTCWEQAGELRRGHRLLKAFTCQSFLCVGREAS